MYILYCEYMKITMWTARNEYGSNLRSNEHYLSRNESKAWKNSVLYGIWTLFITSQVYYEAKKWPAPSWLVMLVPQLEEHYTGIT